jgi:hypothetical protein
LARHQEIAYVDVYGLAVLVQRRRPHLDQRNIGDFRRRKDYDAYQQATGSYAT